MGSPFGVVSVFICGGSVARRRLQADPSALAQEVGLCPFQDRLLNGHATLEGLGSAPRLSGRTVSEKGEPSTFGVLDRDMKRV